MTGWRMEFTVLTDLSASIFAACFMILLIFIGLAQKEQASGPPSPPRAIEATRDLTVTLRQAPAPPELVELLFRHGLAGPPSTRIDLFADRIELGMPGTNEPLPFAPADITTLSGRLGDERAPPILFVFSNALYGATVAALGGRPHVELSVPRGLRDPVRPDRAWSEAFTRLEAEAPDLATFRRGLATLLAGSADPVQPAAREGSPPDASAASKARDPLAEMGREFARRIAILITLAGFLAAIAIRYRVRDVISGTSDAGAARLD